MLPLLLLRRRLAVVVVVVLRQLLVVVGRLIWALILSSGVLKGPSRWCN